MIGLEVDERPVLRAYSMASANYEDETRILQHQGSRRSADPPRLRRSAPRQILVGAKPTGRCARPTCCPAAISICSRRHRARAFLSIIQGSGNIRALRRVILAHGSRTFRPRLPRGHHAPAAGRTSSSAKSSATNCCTTDVTREPSPTRDGLTDLIESGKLFKGSRSPAALLDDDRFMLCGSPAMLKDTLHC